ncbi:1-phosphatidylinositol phosphodiesterase [Plakobranchus ocellatus]|uniref:1-phosphatidylinositol phosphodiesterase n=1 Tax=Plakobranchus ocellatus TaxID=259542 RepID=A0AAV3YFT6_9GAST|nr:1-phosphatidylinositol phosphodiesterase [Plakobranchus ocellatus]
MDAAFRLRNGTTYFLNDEEFIEYSFNFTSEARVGPITELGLDHRVYHSSAAFTLNDGRVVFLKANRYFIYALNINKQFDFDSEGVNFGGLASYPNASLNWRGDYIVFQGCNVWRLSSTFDNLFHLHGGVVDRGLPCNLDAALEWESGAIFIKGSQFWRFQSEMKGPYHIDELNLCSWYICGEATWMTKMNQGTLHCNGDTRLCDLKLNQVTLPGLHNAGSGFDRGFGLVNCWARNHAKTILEQMQLGIRHLDIDTSFTVCGLLGSSHSMFCGGSICRILKQVRTFLSQNPHEIVTMNFNHEMIDPQKVIPALTRQLKSQFSLLLNDEFRNSGERQWPLLQEAVRSNKRVFVFYPAAQSRAKSYGFGYYTKNKWIHTEYWLASTWQTFLISPINSDCSGIVRVTQNQCQAKQSFEILEVSIVPKSSGTCIKSLADLCKHDLHDALKACQPYRFSQTASPNVLLVDYPEDSAKETTSVFHAVYHQNVRNILQHRPVSCRVKIDAAVRKPHSADEVVFFVRSKIITYSFSKNVQINETTMPDNSSVDAAYIEGDKIVVTKGCLSLLLSGSTLKPLSSQWKYMPQCYSPYDAADVWNVKLHTFQGCEIMIQYQTSEKLASYNLPCDVDAAITSGAKTYVFKGNDYWVRTSATTAFTPGGNSLDWTIDAVVC